MSIIYFRCYLCTYTYLQHILYILCRFVNILGSIGIAANTIICGYRPSIIRAPHSQLVLYPIIFIFEVICHSLIYF